MAFDPNVPAAWLELAAGIERPRHAFISSAQVDEIALAAMANARLLVGTQDVGAFDDWRSIVVQHLAVMLVLRQRAPLPEEVN